jgi:UDPglucose 6-dehydrogenase
MFRNIEHNIYSIIMKIGIIGLGVVGNAILQSFKKHNLDPKVYDKYQNRGQFNDTLDTDIIFLCLPTPFDPKMDEYDKSSIHEVCQKLSENHYNGLVVLKSTVEPGTSTSLSEKYSLNIIHNPEFLTARTALQDFENQNHIILGTTPKLSQNFLDMIVLFYKKNYPNALISICSSEISETVKLACNSFYAVKIQYFNEIYFLCQKLNIDYPKVRELMLLNGWIHPYHTLVPGTDGLISYGGACFPKDTNALNSYMRLKGTPHSVLSAAIDERNQMRNN